PAKPTKLCQQQPQITLFIAQLYQQLTLKILPQRGRPVRLQVRAVRSQKTPYGNAPTLGLPGNGQLLSAWQVYSATIQQSLTLHRGERHGRPTTRLEYITLHGETTEIGRASC